MSSLQFPRSPYDQIEGMSYFQRMCDKIRLHKKGLLPSDYHANMGIAMDLWCCELLQIEYTELVQQVQSGSSDQEVVEWAWGKGEKPTETLLKWWNSYMRNFGFQDDFSALLEERKAESGLSERSEIVTFFQFMVAEEGHETAPAL